MSAGLIRGNAVSIPLRDECVDLIVTSPPYFALRSYRDDGEHYGGQIGSEPTPRAFLGALWSVMHECWRVLKPEGVCFVNLGDKRSGSGGHNNANLSRLHQNYGRPESARHGVADDVHRALRRNAPDRYNQAAFGRTKSKMLLPHRFAIGCEDGLADPEGKGWIVRQDIVWSKPNGLPESVTDRPRDSHEYWFMLTKDGRYYSAVDEVREAYSPASLATYAAGGLPQRADAIDEVTTSRPASAYLAGGDPEQWRGNPLGKLPGSVWTIPSEPLRVPDWARDRLDLPYHFAAFPTEWPRRLILGWSPPGVCVECGEGRRPVVDKKLSNIWHDKAPIDTRYDEPSHEAHGNNRKRPTDGMMRTFGSTEATITGYACACPSPTAPTTPAVILDPFVGTGTVPMVARALGRYGVGIDLSADYLRLAKWRTFDSRHAAKAVARTNREAQGQML